MIEVRQRCIAAVTAGVVCCVLLAAPAALAQAQVQEAAPPPAATAPAPPPQKPGVFESIGRFFDQGASRFRDHLRGAKRKMDDLGEDAAANSKDISENAA